MQLTIILAAINGIVFFMLSFGGITEDTYYMLENGAMYVPYIMENGEYYRLFTSIFLPRRLRRPWKFLPSPGLLSMPARNEYFLNIYCIAVAELIAVVGAITLRNNSG